jgi:hypothetical protein
MSQFSSSRDRTPLTPFTPSLSTSGDRTIQVSTTHLFRYPFHRLSSFLFTLSTDSNSPSTFLVYFARLPSAYLVYIASVFRRLLVCPVRIFRHPQPFFAKEQSNQRRWVSLLSTLSAIRRGPSRTTFTLESIPQHLQTSVSHLQRLSDMDPQHLDHL